MNVYFVGNKYDGCYYVRCLVPMVENGWDGSKTSLRSPQADPRQMVQGALNADVIVFQRPDCDNKVAVVDKLKQVGKKVVFDNDDTYKPDSGVPGIMDVSEQVSEINRKLMDFVAKADMVTTTTQFLADEYKQYNDNVVILPNMVDPDDWDEPERNDGYKVRIGLVGSVASNKDYQDIIPLLDELNKRDDVQLVLFALPPKGERYQQIRKAYAEEIAFWDQYNVEWHHFVPMADYHEKLNSLKLDIMLIPRHDSYFNRCKSNLKFLEAAMLEIPVIATGFSDNNSPYDTDINGENGVLIKDVSDWIPKTVELIEDKNKRRKMGEIAKKYVLDNYNIQDHGHLWEDAYKSLYEN